MKRTKGIIKLLVIAGIAVILFSCSKKDDPKALPKVTTLNVTSIMQQTAKGGGNITDDGNADITMRGIVWGASTDVSLTNKIGQTQDGGGSGQFTSSMTNLAPNFTYYVKAYAINSEGTSFGSVKTFTTLLKK